MAKKSQGPKEFTARQDTLEFMEKFPPKPGESAASYAKRIEQKMAAARRVETEKTIEKSRASFDKTRQSIEPKQPKPKKAPKLSAADRAAQRASRALAEAAADAAAAKNFKWGRTQAMRAQTMLARGKKPEEVARAIKVPLRSVQDFAQIRFNREAFGKTVYAASNGPRGKVYATTNINDPNVRRDSTGRPIVIRHGAKPGSTSDIGIAPGEKGFRLPSARVKGRTMTAAQKKEVKRLVTGGYGNEELRNYLERIGLPATTISDLAKARKAAGARVPTVAGVSARRSEEAAHEKAIKAQADKQTKAAKARAAAKPRTLGEVGRSVRYVGSAGPSSPVKRTRGGYGDRPAGPTTQEIRTAKIKQYKTVGGTTRVVSRFNRRGIVETTLQTKGGRRVETATPYTPYRAPSPKPVVTGGARSGEVSKDAVKIGSDAVYKGIVSIYGKSAADSIMKDQSRNLQAGVRETIQRRIDLGLPVGKGDIRTLFSSGGAAVNVIRGINAFIPDPTSPLIDRTISPYIADVDRPGKIRSYTPGARLMGADKDDAGGGDLKAPSKKELRQIEKSGGRKAPVGESDLIPETGKVSRIAPVASMDKSDRHEEVKGRGQGAIGTGDIPRVKERPIPLGAEDVRGRGYAASDVHAKLNQIAITDPKRAAKIAESLGIKNFDPAAAAEQGKFQSQQAANTIADVQASMDAEKRRIEKVDKKNPTAAKDRLARQQAEAANIPKITPKMREIARALRMTEGSAREGKIIQGGRVTGQQIVDQARKLSAEGSLTEADKKAIGNAMPGTTGGSKTGVSGEVLSSLLADRDLASKVIPETIGKNATPREEYIDKAAKKLAAGSAPKQLTAGTAKAASPGRNKKQLLKKISAGLRKVAEQKGASAAPAKVARVKSAPSAPSAPAAKRGRPRKEAAAPQPATATAAAAPAASGGSGGSGGGGGGSRGGGSGAEKAMEDRFNRGGGLEGKIRQIDGALEAKGVPPEKRAQILSDIRSAHGQITASGMSDFQAAKSLGFAGTGISKNLEGMAKISPESKEYKSIMQGAIDRALGRKPADAAPVIKEPKAAPAEKKKPAETPAAAKKKATPKPEPKPVAKPSAKTKTAPKPAAKPAEEKKKETARKTAEKKAEQVKKQSEKKVSAPAKPKAIKPMSQEKQRSELAKAAGYRGGAAEAYKSLLRKGVEPQAAKGIVDDGRNSGIKGKQLVDYANRRQKGMDHENAKTAATAKKVGGAPSGPAKAGGKAAAGSSGGSNKPPKGTTSGGRFARGPRGSSGGMSPGIFGQAASGADRGVVGAVKNSIGQITQSLLTAQVIAKVGSLIQQITGGLIGFNMKLEESTIAFKTLFINEQRALGTFMGDTTQATIKANILTKAIQDFANVTPFRFGELVTAAERMKAFGFETKEILPSLQGIGDAVAALGGEDDKLRRITYALGQMKQAGRVYQNDMMQLSNAGIAGYEILAKGLIEEFIKTGRVMVGESGNLYKYNTETIDQVVTDIVKNKGQGVYKVMSAQSNKLIEIFNDLTTEPVEKIRNMTKRGSIDGAAAARYIIKGMEKTYQGGMEALARTMKGAISTVQDTSQYLIAVSFKPIYDHIRNFFYNAGQFMMKAGGKRIADGIAKAITPIGDAAAEAFPKVASFFGEMISAIVNASGSFTKSIAKIQVGAQTLAEYIRDNLVGGMKSVLEILKTDFGQAAIAAVAAMRIIQSAAAANPIVIALGAIVMAMGAVTSGMNKFIKTGSITRDSIETITKEEQNTALAGIEIKEAFIEIGNAIKKAKKQLGPSLTRIFTELAKVLANVGSKAITVIVDVIRAITDVISGILSILSRMPGALSVALAAFVAFKIGASGLALATTSMNALATSMLAVAGAANAIKTGGAVGIIGSILGGGLVQSGARALSGIATGAQIASVAAQTQAFNTGGAVRKLALGEAASSVAITGGGIKQILSGSGKAAAGAADDVAVAAGTAAAPAARTTGIISRIGGVISGVVNGISKLAGGIRMGAGKFALIAFAVLTLIKHIGKVGELFGAFFGMLGRVIGKLGEGVAAVAGFISQIPLIGPIITGITDILGDFFQAFDDLIDISINSVIDLFGSIFPEDTTQKAIRQVKEMNEEIARLIEMGYGAEEAKEIAEAIFLIKKAIETEKSDDPRIQDVNWGMATSVDPSMATQVAADGTPIVASASGLKTIGPGEWISPDQVKDLRDNTDEIIANLDDTARAAFVEAINKARNIRDEYKQMLIDAGMSEEQAAKLSSDRYKGYLDQITGTVKRISASGDIEKIIPSITDLTDKMTIGFGDAADGADAFGVSIDKLQNGDVLAYITDVNGILEKITLQGETAANASQIETIIAGIAGQTRDQAVETGAVPNQAAADKIFEDTKRFYNPKFADAIEGFYTNPITGVREFLGRTIAVRKLLADIKVVAGEVDLGQIYSETVESKLEKAKSAIEKIKAALDPIVDRILSRIRNAAEKQFADRIENVTKILEEQRDAEIDAIQVRIDGINTTYGILDDEIKAQEKKNRVIQIEKTLLDARKNVADAAIAAYGEDVDPIAAAIARREAEISMTEAVKDAELERKKLALDEQQNTIAGIQAIFDIRIEIVTDALEQEKMAFFENIDDIVAKIKEGTITGAAAVAALSGAFTNFGITIPSTAQAIAASGTNTIGSIFTKIISAIDAYRNKLLQVKAIEDTLGDDMADDTPTQEEIDYMKAVAEQEAERKRKSSIAVGKSTAFESIGSVFNEMLRQAMYGKDGKPIAKSLRDKRDKEYNVQAKLLTASLPKAGDYSEAALAKMSAGWLAWTTWLSSVDLMSAVPRAKGGPVASRGQYLVGEKGPELITMGNGSGQVISNFYVKKLTDAFKSFRIGNPAIMPKMAYNMGGGGKAEFSVTINNPQVRTDSDVDKIVEAVNRSQMRMARRLGYS